MGRSYEELQERIRELESERKAVKFYEEMKSASDLMMTGIEAMMDSGFTRAEAIQMVLSQIKK